MAKSKKMFKESTVKITTVEATGEFNKETMTITNEEIGTMTIGELCAKFDGQEICLTAKKVETE